MVILPRVEALVGATFNLPGKVSWGGGIGASKVDLVVVKDEEGLKFFYQKPGRQPIVVRYYNLYLLIFIIVFSA